MGHGNKNDANIFYYLRGDNLLLYMPFPSVTELAQYKITHGSSSSEYEANKFNSSYVPITEENLSSFRDWFIRDKQSKSDYLALEWSYLECDSELTKDMGLFINPGLLFSRKIPNDTQGRIKRYLKDNYPINYENIKNGYYQLDDLNYLDDSVWSTQSVYIKGYEYLLVKFELGYAAKTIFNHYKRLMFYADGYTSFEFWEDFYSYFNTEQFFDEFRSNGMFLFDLRDVDYKDVLEWETENHLYITKLVSPEQTNSSYWYDYFVDLFCQLAEDLDKFIKASAVSLYEFGYADKSQLKSRLSSFFMRRISLDHEFGYLNMSAFGHYGYEPLDKLIDALDNFIYGDEPNESQIEILHIQLQNDLKRAQLTLYEIYPFIPNQHSDFFKDFIKYKTAKIAHNLIRGLTQDISVKEYTEELEFILNFLKSHKIMPEDLTINEKIDGGGKDSDDIFENILQYDWDSADDSIEIQVNDEDLFRRPSSDDIEIMFIFKNKLLRDIFNQELKERFNKKTKTYMFERTRGTGVYMFYLESKIDWRITYNLNSRATLYSFISKYKDFSPWVFYELTYPKEILDQINSLKPSNLIDIIKKFEVMTWKEVEFIDSMLCLKNHDRMPYNGFIFEPFLGSIGHECFQLVFVKEGCTAWIFNYSHNDQKISFVNRSYSPHSDILYKDVFIEHPISNLV